MIEPLDQDTLDSFHKITSYDIESFFDLYLEFNDNHYTNIANYFTGVTKTLPAESVTALSELIKEHKKVIDVIILNSTSLIQYRFWVLGEYVDDIGHSLESANNFSKWSRSSSTKDGYKQQVLTELLLSQGQTLEDVERKILNSNDPDGWVNTALENGLTEEGYALQGGELIRVILKNNTSLQLEGIVDNINTPEKTYGLDIDQNIAIDPATQDLVVLGYKDTLLQCMKILTDLNVEDDPSFPDRGLRLKGSVLGGNMAGISYPTILRDLASNFSTDDSFGAIAVNDIRRDADSVFLDFTVETRAGDSFSDSVQL